MPQLQFNPYHKLLAYDTMADGTDCPFQEGEQISMSVIVAYSLSITGHRQGEEDLRNLNAINEVILYPHGQAVQNEDYLWAQITWMAGEQRPKRIKVRNDKEFTLQVLLLSEEDVTVFPFRSGDIVTIPLVAENLQKHDPSDNESWAWSARLIPFGRNIGGLVVAEVKSR